MDQGFEEAKSAIMEILFIYIILAFSISFCLILFRFIRKKNKKQEKYRKIWKNPKKNELDDVKDKLRKL